MATTIDMSAQLQEYIDIIAEDESKMKKLFNYVKRLATKREPEQPVISKEDVVESLREGLEDIELEKQGIRKFVTWEEFKDELQREGYYN